MHPSIIKIKLVFTSIRLFDFMSSDDISKIITSSDSTKKTNGVIPTKIVKLASKDICKDLENCINESIKKNITPDIKPIFKKEDPLNKENCRPVSVFPEISKKFEKVLFAQLTKYSNRFLSLFLCGFRKGYSTQYALVKLFQKWKESIDKPDGIIGTLLMDLSKAYDGGSHKLIIAILPTY